MKIANQSIPFPCSPRAWMALAATVMLGIFGAAAVVVASPQTAQKKSELETLCTHDRLQALAPPGLQIRDIPNLNPSVSAVRKTKAGVAYIPANAFGDDAPEYCLITGSFMTNPTTGKVANFGAALPAPKSFRQRLLQQGCGGTCGDVFNNGPPAAPLIRRGYSVWVTDDGHVDSNYRVAGFPITADYSWAIKRAGVPDADAIKDYAHRAVHTLAQVGRSFTNRIYGAPGISRAYFMGCSDGGREAMQEASLYPEDFDGIIAGAPYLDPAATAVGGLATQVAQLESPGGVLSTAAVDVVSRAILAKCDAADGVKDGLVQNPAACEFNPQLDIRRCTDKLSSSGKGCLTADQIDVVTAIFNAVRDPQGNVLAPGYSTVSTGSHNGGWGLAGWVVFPTPQISAKDPLPFGPSQDNYFWAWSLNDGLLRNVVDMGRPAHDSLSVLSMRFAQNGAPQDGSYGAVLPNAVMQRIERAVGTFSTPSPYPLASFIEEGKRLIMWHGYADGPLTSYVSIRYYKELAELHGGYENLGNSVRLFMAPDVAHCGWGGAGPSSFQTLYHKVEGELPPPVMDAEHDLLMALEHWVEDRAAPQHILATKYEDDDPTKAVVRTMPLCPFPIQARYDGRGDVNAATSWSCPAGDRRQLEIGAFGKNAGLGN